MKKTLIISSFILSCMSIQAQENKFEYRQAHPEYFAKQIKENETEAMRTEKEKYFKRHNHYNKKEKIEEKSFLNCIGRKEGDIIEMELENDKIVSLKCTLIAIPIKKGF
tara:strand:+ start:8482 stop:8808 length:327 start_codon:yes stop_codon:yes gene_type:complete